MTEQKNQLAEQKNQLAAKDNQLAASIKMLSSFGVTSAQIAAQLGITIEQVESVKLIK